MHTIQKLRQLGHTVYVTHERNLDHNGISPRGGRTKVEVTFSQENHRADGVTFTGEALCSKNDNYNKKLGVRIALGRALKGTDHLIPSDAEIAVCA